MFRQGKTASGKTKDKNGNDDTIVFAQKRPLRKRKGVVRRTEYLSKADLDFRPYVQRKHLLDDPTLEAFLKKSARRFRRPAMCVHGDDNETRTLIKFVENTAPLLSMSHRA